MLAASSSHNILGYCILGQYFKQQLSPCNHISNLHPPIVFFVICSNVTITHIVLILSYSFFFFIGCKN